MPERQELRPVIHPSLDAFIAMRRALLDTGPVALIFVEDDVEVAATLRHHLQSGFKAVIALMPDTFEIPADLSNRIERISFDCSRPEDVFAALNRLIRAASGGCWMYYCYNAKFLFFPFCETRSLPEMLRFHAEERRDAMLTYVIDLYAGDLEQFPSAVALKHAYLDKSGYYAQARRLKGKDSPEERQLDFFGGLRWRFEEHIPKTSRKIDRIALFRCRPDLELRSDHTFNIAEYNTFSCPWHHNLTAAICSFRTAKALKRNPGSSESIQSFRWQNSVPFEWHSRQLLDLGLMEPGQWF